MRAVIRPKSRPRLAVTACATLFVTAGFVIGGSAPAHADSCFLILTCPASPSPVPVAPPPPSPSPPTSPKPPPPAPPQPPPKTGAVAAPAQPSPSVSAAAAQVAARFRNAAFLDDLLTVLQHPTSDQQPDLKHFRVAAGLTADETGAAAAQDAARTPALEVAIFILVWAVAMAVGLGLGLRRRIRFARLRAMAILSLIPLVAVTAAGLRASGTLRLAPSTAPVSTRAFGPGLQSSTTIDDLDPLHKFLEPSAPAWNRLVSIESQVTLHQDQLKAQELQIQRIATSVAGSASAQPSATVSPTAVSSDVEAVLVGLLAQHDATAQAFKASLQQEYEVYREAAQQPALRDQILGAVAKLPQADAKDAVSYNLQVLQTQLTQESAINAAAAKLSAIGSLSSAQLAAMRRHQPFIIPLEGPMTQGFGPTDFSLEPPLTYNGVFYPHFHTGFDIAAPLDTPVHAAADGVIALATATQDSQGHLTGYGNYVVIAHPDGFFTLYGHLDTVAVKEGQVVHQGEIIGQEGSTGLSTGPHVHFEIRHNGTFLDPAPYLQGQTPG
ncbi:MAG TPA: M23 family metallopeptidase [Candidatus Dormibacteraeota bacterium]|jgi:murein DD-endopeptidase MepM/ murein hydrolase activator NlpD|nr:M23 family metallopeptidase [Candidatus Dormibacteraeota bacterium]